MDPSTGTASPRANGARVAIVAMIAAGIAFCLLNVSELSPALTGVLMVTANALPIVAIGAGLRAYRPARPVVWWLLLVNVVLLTLGYALFYAPAFFGNELPGVPSLADVAWILSYPPLIAALALALARRESLSFALIDIAALSLALLILVTDVLIGPYLSRADLPLGMKLVQCSYAFFDVFLAVGALRLLAARHGHTISSVLLALSSLAYVASDVGWNWQLLLGTYGEGTWLSSGWLLAGALLAGAAVAPSMKRFSERPERRVRALTWRNAAVLALSPVLAPAVLAAHHVIPGLDEPTTLTIWMVLVVSVLLAALASLRVGLLIRDSRRLSSELTRALSEQGRLLERSEEQYQGLVEQLPGAVFITASADDQIGLIYMSPQIERLTGLTSDECHVDSLAIVSAVHPDDRDRVIAHVREQHSVDHSSPIEYRFVRPDGELLWVREESTSKLDEATGVRYVQGILLDITDRMRVAQERDALEADLRLAQKLEAVGQLAAGIAHEINTPIQYVGDTVTFLDEAFTDLDELVGAYGAVCAGARNGGVKPEHLDAVAAAEEIADLDYLRERVPAAFGRARDGIERVSKIVGAMREFAHPPTIEMAPADLNAALESTLTVARSEYKYVADVATDLGALPAVVCNVGDLNQVFLNLLVNAAHAIEDVVGGTDARGTITVTTRTDGGDAIVRIADTGTGIPADVAERVFDPFFTTKEVGRGTGQGLAIAHRIVTERHDGELTFTSTPGEGTAFEIRVPIAGVGA
jgi:PAS domain S-box-containing protein